MPDLPIPEEAVTRAEAGSTGSIVRLGRWPDPGDPGRFVIRCSCRRWNATGTADEIGNLGEGYRARRGRGRIGDHDR